MWCIPNAYTHQLRRYPFTIQRHRHWTLGSFAQYNEWYGTIKLHYVAIVVTLRRCTTIYIYIVCILWVHILYVFRLWPKTNCAENVDCVHAQVMAQGDSTGLRRAAIITLIYRKWRPTSAEMQINIYIYIDIYIYIYICMCLCVL